MLYCRPPCNRVKCVKDRGYAIYNELEMEYAVCFRNVGRGRQLGWRKSLYICLQMCAPAAMWVAMSTTIPMLNKSIEDGIRGMEYVALFVTKLFLAHLKQTWFGIDNDALERLYCTVCTQLKCTKGTLS